MAKPNDDAFATLLDSVYEVKLSDADVVLQCRNIPFVTVMHIITQVVSGAKSQFTVARDDVFKAFQSVREDVTAGNAEASWKEMISALLPVFSGVIAMTPDMTERVLTDVVVGSRREIVRAISTVDAMAIFEAAFGKMDLALLATQLDRAFFGLKGAVDTMGKIMASDDSHQPKKSSSPDSTSQPSDD